MNFPCTLVQALAMSCDHLRYEVEVELLRMQLHKQDSFFLFWMTTFLCSGGTDSFEKFAVEFSAPAAYINPPPTGPEISYTSSAGEGLNVFMAIFPVLAWNIQSPIFCSCCMGCSLHLRAPKLAIAMTVFFCRKSHCRQPNRSKDASFPKNRKSRRNPLQGKIGKGFWGGRTLLGAQVSLRFSHLRQKIAIAIAQKSQHLVHATLHSTCRP